jgi:serine/threonine protein kinase
MAYLKPPFRAESMEGLYKRVVKGTYQRLPGHYSVDINDFIGCMLSVNPKARCSSAELLSLPSVIDKIKSGVNLKESVEEAKASLLQTIKFPNNLQYLTDKLPKPNYEPIKLANLSNFEGYSAHLARSEESVVRNKSAASRANRSVIHEQSVANQSHLPVISAKKKNHNQSNHGDSIIKDRINKQHEKVEQQIKRYDEILKKNKHMRNNYDLKRRMNAASHKESVANLHNRSSVERGEQDLIKIYGVKLEHRPDPRGKNKLDDRSARLPPLKNASSVPRGLLMKEKQSMPAAHQFADHRN